MEERSRRIVETAVDLAEKGGFEAVRLRDVAAHAGVALGTLYRRFRSKEDLLLAALDQEMNDVRERVLEHPPEGDTPLERLTSFFQLITRSLCRRPNLARALIRAVATGEPALTQRTSAFHGQLVELIIGALHGVQLSPDAAPTERERRIADALQQVWFASLIGWSSGRRAEAVVVEHTRSAAELMLES